MRISLVASLNGAGHFGRVLKIAEHCAGLRFHVSLVIGKAHQSIEAGRVEKFAALRDTQVFVLSAPLGLEGPQWGHPNNQTWGLPDGDLATAIKNSDAVITDNSLWPLSYSDNVLVMAQFIWLDYWRALPGPNLTERLIFEIENMRSIRKRFASPVFVQNVASIQDRTFFPLRLLEYPDDSRIRELPVADEIWIVSGTTGLASECKIPVGPLSNGFRLIQRETFRLANSDHRPAAVMGRPGMGSIRDSLAAGIPFLPHLAGNDPELIHNTKVLSSLGLASTDSQGSFLANLSSDNLATRLRSLTGVTNDFFEQVFVPLGEAVSDLLSHAGGASCD